MEIEHLCTLLAGRKRSCPRKIPTTPHVSQFDFEEGIEERMFSTQYQVTSTPHPKQSLLESQNDSSHSEELFSDHSMDRALIEGWQDTLSTSNLASPLKSKEEPTVIPESDDDVADQSHWCVLLIFADI